MTEKLVLFQLMTWLLKIAVMSANDRLRVYRQLSSLDHINPTMSLEAAAGSNCVLLQLTVDW